MKKLWERIKGAFRKDDGTDWIRELAFDEAAYEKHAEEVAWLRTWLKSAKDVELTLKPYTGIAMIIENVDGEPWMMRGTPKPGRWRFDAAFAAKHKGILTALKADLEDIDYLLASVKLTFGSGWKDSLGELTAA